MVTNTPTQEHPQNPQLLTITVRNPNTGFPEPFNHERNTTLPHPEAIVGAKAMIETADAEGGGISGRGWFAMRGHGLIQGNGRIHGGHSRIKSALKGSAGVEIERNGGAKGGVRTAIASSSACGGLGGEKDGMEDAAEEAGELG
jgi:hypothetical protein